MRFASFVVAAAAAGTAWAASAQSPMDMRSLDATVRELNARTQHRLESAELACEITKRSLESGIRRGDADAMIAAGVRYRDGSCGQQDHAEALRLFKLAEEQRAGSARIQIALMSARGQGMPQSFAEAARVIGSVPDAASEREVAASGYLSCLRYLIGRGFATAREPELEDRSRVAGVRLVWRLDSGLRLWSLVSISGTDGTTDSMTADRDLRTAARWQVAILGAAADSLPAWPEDAGAAPVYEIPITMNGR